MQSLEVIKNKISGTESLRSIVRTMKILAAVSIRQHEKKLNSLQAYGNTIELGLQVVLKSVNTKEEKRLPVQDKLGAIIFGSDMGLCGQFNEQMAAFATDSIGTEKALIMTVGEKVLAKLDGVWDWLPFPATLSAGVESVLRNLLDRIDIWRTAKGVDRVALFYNRLIPESLSYEPVKVMLLPVDENYLEGLRKKKWRSRSIPMFKMPKEELFAVLIKNLLYVSLYRAFVESLAAESAARLTSMEAAEKHIDERIKNLNELYNSERQDAITSELLDIIAGYEILTKK